MFINVLSLQGIMKVLCLSCKPISSAQDNLLLNVMCVCVCVCVCCCCLSVYLFFYHSLLGFDSFQLHAKRVVGRLDQVTCGWIVFARSRTLVIKVFGIVSWSDSEGRNTFTMLSWLVGRWSWRQSCATGLHLCSGTHRESRLLG